MGRKLGMVIVLSGVFTIILTLTYHLLTIAYIDAMLRTDQPNLYYFGGLVNGLFLIDFVIYLLIGLILFIIFIGLLITSGK